MSGSLLQLPDSALEAITNKVVQLDGAITLFSMFRACTALRDCVLQNRKTYCIFRNDSTAERVVRILKLALDRTDHCTLVWRAPTRERLSCSEPEQLLRAVAAMPSGAKLLSQLQGAVMRGVESDEIIPAFIAELCPNVCYFEFNRGGYWREDTAVLDDLSAPLQAPSNTDVLPTQTPAHAEVTESATEPARVASHAVQRTSSGMKVPQCLTDLKIVSSDLDICQQDITEQMRCLTALTKLALIDTRESYDRDPQDSTPTTPTQEDVDSEGIDEADYACDDVPELPAIFLECASAAASSLLFLEFSESHPNARFQPNLLRPFKSLVTLKLPNLDLDDTLLKHLMALPKLRHLEVREIATHESKPVDGQVLFSGLHLKAQKVAWFRLAHLPLSAIGILDCRKATICVETSSGAVQVSQQQQQGYDIERWSDTVRLSTHVLGSVPKVTPDDMQQFVPVLESFRNRTKVLHWILPVRYAVTAASLQAVYDIVKAVFTGSGSNVILDMHRWEMTRSTVHAVNLGRLPSCVTGIVLQCVDTWKYRRISIDYQLFTFEPDPDRIREFRVQSSTLTYVDLAAICATANRPLSMDVHRFYGWSELPEHWQDVVAHRVRSGAASGQPSGQISGTGSMFVTLTETYSKELIW